MTTPLLQPADREAKKLIVPLHASWSFGGVPFAPISKDEAFGFSYDVDWTAEPTDLKAAVRAALTSIHTQSGKSLSICLSGSDSEIIAREAHSLNIPFQLYFLNVWDNNSIEFETANTVALSLGKALNLVTLSKSLAWGSVLPAQYSKLQALKPTYLVLPYLLDQIPANTFIIGGEGDPEKNGAMYAFSAGEFPIATTEVFYRQWALENNRDCDMYFFSSTPELLLAYLKHPLLTRSENSIDTRAVKDAVWPGLLFSEKTTNWLNVPGSNAEVQSYLASLMQLNGPVRPQTVNLQVSL